MSRSHKAGRTGGQVRIIAGEWRRRIIPVADRPGLRPTTDRVRETLFNWLNLQIPAARVLDLYAGSGALGFEAASRGAKKVVMIEQDSLAVSGLRSALDLLGNQEQTIADRVEIIQADALQWCETSPNAPFDILFLDPPFATDLLLPSLDKLSANHFLRDGSLIYLEHAQKKPHDLPDYLVEEKSKKAGQVCYGLYRVEV